MAGPAMAIGYLLLAILGLGLLAFLLYLLYFAIIYRHRPLKAILAGILAVCLIAVTLFLFLYVKKPDPNLFGDYKLNKLDGRKCENCKVKLKEDYTYDIIVNNQVVGNGKWDTKTAIDVPGIFVSLDYGPSGVLWQKDWQIESIYRTEQP